MQIPRRRLILVLLSILSVASAYSKQHSLSSLTGPSPDLDPVARTILSRALADGIDLLAFNFSRPALDEIVYWSHFEASPDFPRSLLEPAPNATTVDVHVHYAPKWYGALRQDEIEWTLKSQLAHAEKYYIAEMIFSVPNPNIFLGDRNATVAIARLLNENMAALVQALPRRFKFFATTPLPYVEESITEAKYGLESLGALGVALASNHEGHYLGVPQFRPFFTRMNEQRAIIFVHPNEPLLEANPTIYTSVLAETFLNLALSQTLANFPSSYSLDFIIPHAGGSLPSIIDRSMPPGPMLDDIMQALRTRCWWDTAGVRSHQLGGLLAYSIDPSFLLYGSDFPYLPLPCSVERAASSVSLSVAKNLLPTTTITLRGGWKVWKWARCWH
ncbi:hypothetical protein C8J57DRAFT_1279690 [Mycena rebaudengoi]|nr:hypothetical protein C8J57DRAFT_1279690 [Mycena rebaudengoi]